MSWLRTNWLAILVLAAIVASFFVNRHDTTVQTNEANVASIARSVDTCRRSNPSRAYLRLRAKEFTRTTAQAPSYTTQISSQVYAILNCEATVKQHGQPVPMSGDLQKRYLVMFRQHLVPVTRENKIVGSIPFELYFTDNGLSIP